ncbi:MAG: hypothetical protein ACRC28_03890 [Clostridium sp.]|uniref:hypothetical protein n=1 Tax=Clostridium sp. TaxID=1506 RepID=UPI003F31982D
MRKWFKRISFICTLLIIGGICTLGLKEKDIKVTAQKEEEENLFLKYENERFGFSGVYPKFLTEKFGSENGDGIILKDKNNEVTLIMSGINNILEESPKVLLENGKKNKNILYEEEGKDFYKLSWEEEGIVKYDYRKVGSKSIQGILIEYPKSREKEFEKVIEKINENFKTGNLEEFS